MAGWTGHTPRSVGIGEALPREFTLAISIGLGMIPLVAPDFKMWLPHAIHPLIDSGIILAALGSVLLNVFFNGAKAVSDEDLREAAIAGGEH